jgi:hypothetical protein
MARIVPSALVDSIKGKFNGDVIQTRRGTVYRRKGTNPRNTRTSPQTSVRQFFSYLSGAYDELSTDFKTCWDQYAAYISETVTGFNSFMSLNTVLLYADYSTLSRVYEAPVARTTPAAPSSFALSYNSVVESFCAEWATPSEPDYYVQAFFSPVTGYRDTLFPSWSFAQTSPSWQGYCYINAAQFVAGTQVRVHLRALKSTGEVSSWTTTKTETKT